MKNKIKEYLPIIASAFAIGYAFMGFILNDFIPADWPMAARGIYIFLCAFFTLAFVPLSEEFKQKNKD